MIWDCFGIEHGLMTTVHSYTNDQNVLDVVHKDLRRARSAGQNIIPTGTGAARALALVIPELKGRFDGFSLRVPTPTVSVVDFVAVTTAAGDRGERERRPQGGGRRTDEGPARLSPRRSWSAWTSRATSARASSTRDSTMVAGENLLKVVAWYDNEWGYSCRVADLAKLHGRSALSRRPP